MPMPSMAASDVDHSGASTNAITTPVNAPLTTRPATATSNGSPAATTLPKVSRRIRAATASPIASDPTEPPSARKIACPPSATRIPAVLLSSATSISRVLSSTGMSVAFTTSRRRFASRVRPSADTAPGVTYGSLAPATCGTVVSSSSSSVTSRRTPSSRTPASARTTTVTTELDWLGNRCSSTCWAFFESDPGAE